MDLLALAGNVPLCLPCHRGETAALRRRMAARRAAKIWNEGGRDE